MVQTGQQRDKSSNEFRYVNNEGTAARTRPFSVEEILLRREKKKLITSAEDLVLKTLLDDKNGEKKDSVIENVKKTNLGKRPNSDKELVKDCSSRGKQKDVHTTGPSFKVTPNKDKSRDRGYAEEKKRSHHRREEDHDAGSKIEVEKKQDKDMRLKDKSGDRGRNSERQDKRESKRKHRIGSAERKLAADQNDIRKHTSHRRQVDSYSDRKNRNKLSSEVSRDSYRDREEPNPKRRRSASREHHRARDRSVSASPKERKHTSYRERQRENSSYYSLKEKRDRLHSEVDKNRKNSNASGGYHRRYGDSGIGGYSPRKRRTEAAIKTPSPTIRSPERRAAAWDIPPAGAENGASVPTLASLHSSQQTLSLSNGRELSAPSPVKSTALNLYPVATTNAAPSVENSALEDAVQLTQATRPSRRLYVENVPVSASDKALLECFNKFLLSSSTNRVQGRQPCISCMVNKEKNIGLLEFLTPEDATTALAFDGNSFSGSILRVKRPKDFVEAATGVLDKFGAKIDSVSDFVKDSPHKIFIGGISKILSSNMLREIVSVFGQLKAYHFECKEFGLSYAFLEYADQSVTQKACAGLNGMTLGGHVITVIQATPDASGEEANSGHPCYSIPDHAKPLLEDPTPVLMLTNVFSEEEFGLLSEIELEEILEDVRLECVRFGTVKSVNVIRCSGNSVIGVDASVVSDNGGAERLLQESAGNFGPTVPMDEYREADGAVINEKLDDGPREHHNNHQTAAENAEDDKDKCLTDLALRKLNHSEANLESDASTKSNADVSVDVELHFENTDSNLLASHELEVQSSESDMADGLVSERKLKGNSDDLKESEEETGIHLQDNNELQNEPIEANTIGLEDNSELQRTIEMIGLENSDELQVVPTEAEQAGQDKLQGEQEQGQTSLDKVEIKTCDPLVFEPGSIFVEFARKEGACLAAHFLHGRLYGTQVVSTGYVSLDQYKARFPR